MMSLSVLTAASKLTETGEGIPWVFLTSKIKLLNNENKSGFR